MISVFPTSTKLFFLSPFRTVLNAIHMQVTDRPSPDAPSLTQAIIVQMVYWIWQIKASRVFVCFYVLCLCSPFCSNCSLISPLLCPLVIFSPFMHTRRFRLLQNFLKNTKIASPRAVFSVKFHRIWNPTQFAKFIPLPLNFQLSNRVSRQACS